ncbi:MAG: hypothetical protein NTX45_13570 [Proteobacteria bacterium]|nr:hypothetical protein [Pseudomonadota bacterium]
MKENSYGQFKQTIADDDVARRVEEIAVRGYAIIFDACFSIGPVSMALKSSVGRSTTATPRQ